MLRTKDNQATEVIKEKKLLVMDITLLLLNLYLLLQHQIPKYTPLLACAFFSIKSFCPKEQVIAQIS